MKCEGIDETFGKKNPNTMEQGFFLLHSWQLRDEVAVKLLHTQQEDQPHEARIIIVWLLKIIFKNRQYKRSQYWSCSTILIKQFNRNKFDNNSEK
jgi:hypothetical protein